jgi:hypothetical protein
VLPHIDEHAATIDASPDRVWPALGEVLIGSLGSPRSARVARILGCRDAAGHGDVLEEGAAVPGFRVTSAEPAVKLVLEGEHRFSRYSLAFRLDPVAGGSTLLAAETRAVFPGLRGRVYRAAVIGTRGHVVAVRRLLGAVRRRAEAPRDVCGRSGAEGYL